MRGSPVRVRPVAQNNNRHPLWVSILFYHLSRTRTVKGSPKRSWRFGEERVILECLMTLSVSLCMKVWRAAESGQWLKRELRFSFFYRTVLSPPVLISTKGLERLLQLCNFRVRPVAQNRHPRRMSFLFMVRPLTYGSPPLLRSVDYCFGNSRVRPVAQTLIIKKNDTKIELKNDTKIDTTSVAYFTKICSVSIGL